MKDTLRDKCDASDECLVNCCISPIIAPMYFVVFVLMAQFVLVNVVIAVLMKHLEESHQAMDEDEDYEIDMEIAKEIEAEKKALKDAIDRQKRERELKIRRPLVKMASLPNNFAFAFEIEESQESEEEDLPDIPSANISHTMTNNNIKPIIKLNRTHSQSNDCVVDLNDHNDQTRNRITASNPKITIESDSYETQPQTDDICSPELLATNTCHRKFSDFMDEESTTLTNCLQPAYPELSKESDQQSLDSLTWSAEGDSNSSRESATK